MKPNDRRIAMARKGPAMGQDIPTDKRATPNALLEEGRQGAMPRTHKARASGRKK